MKTIKTILQLSLIFIILAVIYFPTFVWLFERYISNDSYYSHGILIPLVSVYLVWLKRDMFKNQQQSGFLLGLVLIVISLLIHFLSIVSEIFFLSGFSIVLLVLGISLFLYGKYVTKIILFPILFLAFMFPLPIVVINSFSLPLKMFVTKSSVFVLKNIFNIPLSNKGFQIFFPYSRLTVENPCSGLRSLIALLAIGSIFGYLLKASMKKRIILFLLAIPVALFSNLIRVILLSLGVYIYGNKMATGFFHDFTGYLVFVIAFFSLMLLAEYLRCKN